MIHSDGDDLSQDSIDVVVELLLNLGFTEDEIDEMTLDNALTLLELDLDLDGF